MTVMSGPAILECLAGFHSKEGITQVRKEATIFESREVAGQAALRLQQDSGTEFWVAEP
jgi:hypothetical protein